MSLLCGNTAKQRCPEIQRLFGRMLRRNRRILQVADSSLPVARRIDAPRGRIANIRRESDCSLNNEVHDGFFLFLKVCEQMTTGLLQVQHERLVKTSQQVSCGFDDITLESSSVVRF